MAGEGVLATKRLGPARTSATAPSRRRRIVIDLGQLAFDVVGNSVSLALPAALWAVLFLCAWEHGPFAESVGLGRRAFWLLLPGAAAVTLANLPVIPVSDDIVGISIGGALFPILVSLLAIGRLAPPGRRSGTAYLATYGVVAALGLGVVLLISAPLPSALGVLVVAAAVPGGVYLVGRSRDDAMLERVAGLLALTDGVLFLTYLFSSASAGVGISEGFPQYLMPPVAAGAVVALVAPRLLRGAEGLALPVAYIAGTFGVLAGADVLREPPLYPSSTPGLYVIGGAGILDLVYLSGLLAFATAYALHRALGRSWSAVPGAPDVSPAPTPLGQLGRSFRRGVDGELSESLTGASLAARSAAGEAAALLQLPPPPPERPWQGLPVPGWVVSDQVNLDAAAAQGTSDGRESYRGWLTARALVGLGLQLSGRRFATAGARTWAFLIDLLVITLPATLAWVYLARTTAGGVTGVLDSLTFNALIYGYIGAGYLYFVIGETVYGTTIGKRILDLAVRQRQMRPPELSSVLVRNAFRVPVLSVVGLTVSVAVALLAANYAPSNVTYEGFGLPAGEVAAALLLTGAAFVVGLLGAVAYLSISATGERQRLGDLAGGTWVVRRATPTVGPLGPPAPPAPGPGAGPSG
jgi:uncharacterized membrane protein/uncharacterized RDD family membrane protein YckC